MRFLSLIFRISSLAGFISAFVNISSSQVSFGRFGRLYALNMLSVFGWTHSWDYRQSSMDLKNNEKYIKIERTKNSTFVARLPHTFDKWPSVCRTKNNEQKLYRLISFIIYRRRQRTGNKTGRRKRTNCTQSNERQRKRREKEEKKLTRIRRIIIYFSPFWSGRTHFSRLSHCAFSVG